MSAIRPAPTPPIAGRDIGGGGPPFSRDIFDLFFSIIFEKKWAERDERSAGINVLSTPILFH